MPEKCLIIGGDLRFVKLSEFLSDNGFEVYILGFDKIATPYGNIHTLNNLISVPCEMNHIILPLPISNDGFTVNMPFSANTVPLDILTSLLKKGGNIFGGKIPSNIYEMYEKHGVKMIDYSEREEFAVLNAISTAEGAIQVAMEETAKTISSQNILILGMGRISKMLIHKLVGFHTDITVAARKFGDLAFAEAYGCKAIHINSLKQDIGSYNLIFNTIPAVVLNEDILKSIDKNALVIDLASKPGGVDFDSASLLGLKIIWLLSLPGKVAPLTAGETIGKTILNILSERRESFE